MTVLSETLQIPIAPITIKRGSLGVIRIGPADIEIPAEDVTITTATITVNFPEEIKAIVTAEISKLKASIMAASKTAEVAPPTVFKFPEVKRESESAQKT